MRDFKYKGKRKDNGKWIYGYLIKTGLGYFIGPYNEEEQVIPDTIGIHFGWVDSDEKEIYTDDQLQIFWTDDESTCEIISYSQEYGYFMYGENPICELVESKVKSKVVGNIHEVNPAGGQSSVDNMNNNFDPNLKAEGEVNGPADALPTTTGESVNTDGDNAGSGEAPVGSEGDKAQG